MRYAIIANPVSGHLSVDAKRRELNQIVSMLGDAEYYGLDTTSASDFAELVGNVAKAGQEHIVIYGGDGTVHSVFNNLNPVDHTFSLIPRGTGNALMYALKISSRLERLVMGMRNGTEKTMDVLLHEESGRIGYMASVGIDGTILELQRRIKEYHPKSKILSFMDYVLATLYAVCRYERPDACVSCFEQNMRELNSLIITKIPNYGMGLKIAPQTKMDDGLLHITCLNGGIFQAAGVAATSYLGGNCFGYRSAVTGVNILTTAPVSWQIDGEPQKKECSFTFSVVPNAIRWMI